MGRKRRSVLRLQFCGLDVEVVGGGDGKGLGDRAQGHVGCEELRLQRRGRLDLEAHEQDVGDEVVPSTRPRVDADPRQFGSLSSGYGLGWVPVALPAALAVGSIIPHSVQ